MTITVAHQQLLTDVTLYLMGNDKSFTSVDVNNIARTYDSTFNIRNRNVAEWLRSHVDMIADVISTTYSRTNIIVDSNVHGKTTAHLYQPNDANPSDYLDRDQRVITQTTPSRLSLLDMVEAGEFKSGELVCFYANSSGTSKYEK